MESAKRAIRNKHIELIAKVYRNMALEEFASAINLTCDEAEQGNI